MATRGRLPSTLRALAPTVLTSMALAVAGLCLVRSYVSPDLLRASNEVTGNYLQTLGTIYAVLLAFVVVIVWQQFNDARTFVEREANELLDLLRTVKGLSEPLRGRLFHYLRQYVEAVLGKEWAAMANDRPEVFEETWCILDQVSDALHQCDPAGEREQALYAEALCRLNDLSDSRTNRISAGCLRIPLSLKVLLYTGGGITVASMYLFAVDRFVLHALMTAALAGAVAHVLHLVHDLDDAFDGDWQVPRAPFERIRAHFESNDAGA